MLSVFLISIMLFINMMMIIERNRVKMLLYFSSYSLIASILYFIYKAPDVALSEIVIGVAFIPLILSIGISKQQSINVLFHVKSSSVAENIHRYCNVNDLRYNQITSGQLEKYYAVGVFSTITVDAVVSGSDDGVIIEVNEGSTLYEDFRNLFFGSEYVDVRKVEELDV